MHYLDNVSLICVKRKYFFLQLVTNPVNLNAMDLGIKRAKHAGMVIRWKMVNAKVRLCEALHFLFI